MSSDAVGSVSASAEFEIEFNEHRDARRINELVHGGMRLQQALDFLELRLNEHYTVTRADRGPDGLDLGLREATP